MILVLLAGGASFLLTFVTLPFLIKYLVRLKMLQKVRDEGPATHKAKSSTPTMGGIVILAATTVTFILGSLFLSSLASRMTLLSPHEGVTGAPVALVLFLLLAFLGNGLIGLADDLAMVRHGRSLGLKARHKLIFQTVIAGVLSFIFVQSYPSFRHDPVYDFTPIGVLPTGTIIPYLKEIDLGWLLLPLFFLVFLATTNAVNLTDGLDGLAAGTVLISLLFFFSLSLGFKEWALALFLSALAGSLLAFLWYNCYPAKIFMGDSGSLALGGALAASAFLTKTPLWLLLVGGIFVAEALSVIIQVVYFKLTKGKRIFKMSPLHHHFEISGVPEPQVTARFWIVQALLLAIAMLLSYWTFPFYRSHIW